MLLASNSKQGHCDGHGPTRVFPPLLSVSCLTNQVHLQWTTKTLDWNDKCLCTGVMLTFYILFKWRLIRYGMAAWFGPIFVQCISKITKMLKYAIKVIKNIWKTPHKFFFQNMDHCPLKNGSKQANTKVIASSSSSSLPPSHYSTPWNNINLQYESCLTLFTVTLVFHCGIDVLLVCRCDMGFLFVLTGHGLCDWYDECLDFELHCTYVTDKDDRVSFLLQPAWTHLCTKNIKCKCRSTQFEAQYRSLS